MNTKMPQLKECFEAAGFTNVKTVFASGNVLFDSRASDGAVERKAEVAMPQHLGRTFDTIARRADALNEPLDADPFARFKLPGNPVFMALIETCECCSVASGSHFACRSISAVACNSDH